MVEMSCRTHGADGAWAHFASTDLLRWTEHVSNAGDGDTGSAALASRARRALRRSFEVITRTPRRPTSLPLRRAATNSVDKYRSDFSRNFVLLACTTMMIIAMVKSALAISIGLLGALSIVRFRAAIKEPEELCYLFLAIGLGVGFGASVGLGFLTPEPYITLITFAFLTSILFIRRQFTTADVGYDYHLLVKVYL